MKKILCILLIFTFIFSAFCGCVSVKKPQSKENVVESTDWKDMRFSLNGHVVQLPCSWTEFSETTKYTLENAIVENSVLRAGLSSVPVVASWGNNNVYVILKNNSDEEKIYTECDVCGIEAYAINEDFITNIVFASDIKLGERVNLDELIERFGEYSLVVDNGTDGYVWNNGSAFFKIILSDDAKLEYVTLCTE